MPLAQQDLESIGDYVKKNLPSWLAEQSYAKPAQVYEIELRERMVRVEEELKNQRELMLLGFEQADKRFAEVQANMDKRFEQVDKRFEQVDKRFESLTSRLDSFMRWSFGITITVGGLVVAAIKYLP